MNMSLLSGMNGMLNDEAATEAAVDLLLENQLIAMEADAIIDEMVDEDDDLEYNIMEDDADLLEEMEGDIADESYSAIQDTLYEQAISNMANGMETNTAYETATESLLEYADSFYSDDDSTCGKVKNMIHAASEKISLEALRGDSFLNSLIHPEEDYDTEDPTIGDDNGAADFLENSTIADLLHEDPDDNTTSYGDGVADHQDNGTGAYPNSKDPADARHSALESAFIEEDDEDLDDVDSALENILIG